MLLFIQEVSVMRQSDSVSEELDTENVQCALDFENTMNELETQLYYRHLPPKEVALRVMEAACKFYDADWCGLIQVDLDLGLWKPLWWHNECQEDKTTILTNEFESSEFLDRWVKAVRRGTPMVVSDAEDVKDTYPDEYRLYERLGIKSVLAIPLEPRQIALIAVRKRNTNMAHLSIVIEKQMLPNKIFHIDLFISARKHKTTLIFPAAKKCRAGQDFSSACGENLLWLVANLKIRMRNIKDFVSPLKVRKLLLKGFIKRHTLNTFFGTDKGNFRPNLEMVLQFLETLLDNLIVRQARIHCNKPRFLGFPLFSFFSG